MQRLPHNFLINLILILSLTLSGCTSLNINPNQPSVLYPPYSDSVPVDSTPLPERPIYKPGQLVDYTAQSGDTLPALAARFNTTIKEIREANPIIPDDATTMPPGFPMKIPIYYRALWASPFQILPDYAFVDGPKDIGFNTAAFVSSRPGWLKDYRVYAAHEWRTGAGVVDYVALNYSISPRLLLAVLEYQTGALSNPKPPPQGYSLGLKQLYYDNPYLQLVIAANTLNNGYYGWRSGEMIEFEEPDGTLIRPDPWQGAASVAIQYYFSRMFSGEQYKHATSYSGFFKTYSDLFSDPWKKPFVLIPGSLRQPNLRLPIPDNQDWNFTGGPHTGWGVGAPFAAIDLAPPSEHSGCFIPDPPNFVIAAADGLIVRSDITGLALDLDSDGDERTGWVIFYLHLAAATRAPAGKQLHAGEKIGYPSCEGGEATGTHVHIARKYNGEWIPADSPVEFDLSGWIVHSSHVAYEGTLLRDGVTVTACVCSDYRTVIRAGP